MEQLTYYCGVVVAIAGAVAIIVKIVKMINEFHDNIQKYDAYQEQIDEIRTDTNAKMQEMMSEQYILTKSMLAVLEGLKQLNCNGPVTEARNELESYINERAHHT